MLNNYPWHIPNWRIISAAFRNRCYPHALLLEGPVGLGKNHFALQLAAKILCNPLLEQACGSCRSCLLWEARTHPDFYTLMPGDKSVITIAQVRERIQQLTHTPHVSAFQVMIISPAEAMHHAASNALLKTLEEPLGKVVIILVANQLSNLPSTIVSRCQRFRFSYPAYEQAVPWLVSQGVGDEGEARVLLHQTGGSPLLALEWIGNTQGELRKAVIEKLLQLLQEPDINRDIANVADVVGVLKEYELFSVLQVMFSVALDVFKLCVNAPDYSLENRDYRERLHQIRSYTNGLTLAKWLPQCLRVRERLSVHSGVNAVLALEALLLRWQQLGAVSYVKAD